jgi:hypothetical protein
MKYRIDPSDGVKKFLMNTGENTSVNIGDIIVANDIYRKVTKITYSDTEPELTPYDGDKKYKAWFATTEPANEADVEPIRQSYVENERTQLMNSFREGNLADPSKFPVPTGEIGFKVAGREIKSTSSNAKNQSDSKPLTPADKLKSIGGKEWIKNNQHRIYFNAESVLEAVGYKIDRYDSGKVRMLIDPDGNEVGFSATKEFLDDLDGAFYDVETNKFTASDFTILNKLRIVLDIPKNK